MAFISSPGLKPLTLLTILSAVVLVSGCVNTGPSSTVSYGKGVIITGFESDMGSLAVESKDAIGLMLKIQNQGELATVLTDCLTHDHMEYKLGDSVCPS